MQLPAPLRTALEAEAGLFKLSELTHAHERLSDRYRAGAPKSRLSDAELAAYALTRMPATYAACSAVFQEVSGRFEASNFPVELASLLDLGAGLGAMLWATAESLATLRTATLIEADAGMIRLGKRLTDWPASLKVDWIQDDIRSRALPAADLVTFSYSLGELPAADADALLVKAWHTARKLLVIVEPGTPAGFARVRKWRELLLTPGSGDAAAIVAPCPHEHACPLAGDDWCHFAQRVERTSLHRRLKGGALGHEDEKFSYLAVGKLPVQLPDARIIRHPRVEAGAIQLELCGADGLTRALVTKRDRELFRRARHARWGEPWDMPSARV